MTSLLAKQMTLSPVSAAPLLANLGFLSSSDLPDRPGPAFLLVALRERATLRHFDPETVEYWVSADGRGNRRLLTRRTIVPIETEFSWGMIRIVDRLHVTNEYLTFGGRLEAACVDGTVIGVFTSSAPILRRGGHSQDWDPGAENLGAFLARLLVAVDYTPGFETRVAQADPTTRYAAFVADAMVRYRASAELRAQQPDVWTLLQAEERRLRTTFPTEWADGEMLRREVTSQMGRRPAAPRL